MTEGSAPQKDALSRARPVMCLEVLRLHQLVGLQDSLLSATRASSLEATGMSGGGAVSEHCAPCC